MKKVCIRCFHNICSLFYNISLDRKRHKHLIYGSTQYTKFSFRYDTGEGAQNLRLLRFFHKYIYLYVI